MSKVDIFMPIYIGDYLKDTNRLTTEEHGAYLLLMFDYWQNGPLPDDAAVLARISRLTPDAWSIASGMVLAYFKLDDGRYHHSRIDREIESAKSKKAKYSTRAKKAADARWNATSNASSTPKAMLKTCPSPSPSQKKIYKADAFEKIRLSFCKITGHTCNALSSEVHRQIKKLLDAEYTQEDFETVFTNAAKDVFISKNPNMLTLKYLTTLDGFQAQLNAGPEVQKPTGHIDNGDQGHI